MKTKVITAKGGIYEYADRLAEQLVRLGRAQYFTRDMQATRAEPELENDKPARRKPGRPRKQEDSE
jgi:hypothetical protein